MSAAEIVQVLAGDASVLDGKVFTEEQIDAIKEYRDNLLDLNEEFDAGLDTYYTNIDNYDVVTYEESYIGSQGRDAGIALEFWCRIHLQRPCNAESRLSL